MTTSRSESVPAFLRPPIGNNAFYSREYLSLLRSCVLKAWANPGNSLKREVALTLLADPELRLRICHLEEILRGRQLPARHQANGFTCATAGSVTTNKESPPIQLQTALADPTFSALFELDATVNDPDWGMQVIWLNMTQLQNELGLPSPPQPPPPHSPAPAAATRTSPDTPPSSASPYPAGGSEPARLRSAFEAAFSCHVTNDEDYLALAVGFCLSVWRDAKGLLPPLSLHLTDLAAHLRACSVVDQRLASALQRIASVAQRRSGGDGRVAGVMTQGLTGTVAELLAAPRARMVFRQSESLSRKGERVVSVAMEQLLRISGGIGATTRASPPLPYEAWQRAGTGAPEAAATTVAAPVVTAGGSEAGVGDALPVFLFEYEVPTDLNSRDDMVAPLAAQRDQFSALWDPRAVADVVGRNRTSALTTASVCTSSTTDGGSFSGSGCSPRQAFSVDASHLSHSTHNVQQQTALLHHAWSDVPRVSPSAASMVAQPLHPPPMLQYMASEAVPLRNIGELNGGSDCGGAGVESPLMTATSDGGAGLYGSFQGLGGLALGIAAAARPADNGRSVLSTLEGTSPSNGLNRGRRTHPSNGGGGGASSMGAESLLHNNYEVAGSLGQIAEVALGASPGGHTGELHVPQEIADVWSNAAGTAASSNGGGGHTTRRSSAAASTNGGFSGGGFGALGGDSGLGGVFSMSPTQENSHWDRMAARVAAQHLSTTAGTSGGRGCFGTAIPNLGFLGLSGFGLGGFGAMNLTAATSAANGGADGGGSSLVVGSAPAVSDPSFLHGSAAAAVAEGFGFGGGRVGGGGGFPSMSTSTAIPTEYPSWQSSSPELSNSVGGRSAPADHAAAAAAIDAWMMSYNARVNGGGGSHHLTNGGCVATASLDSRGCTASRNGMGLSPSAIIGFDASNHFNSSVSRRAAISGPTSCTPAQATAGSPAKGTIAAAASPHLDTATTCGHTKSGASTSANAADANPGGSGISAAVDGSSRQSSLDSAEALNNGGGGGTNTTVLTGWSAMAARGPAVHQHTASMHLGTAAAAGGRMSSSSLPHGLLAEAGMTPATVMSVQGITAGMGAIGAGLSGPRPGGPNPAGVGCTSAAAILAPSGLAGMPSLQHPPRDVFGGGKGTCVRLSQRMREEIVQLIRTVPGLKAEDFDDGVLHQLTLKKSEEEAVGALRTLATENLSGIQHMAAYINHIIKNYHHLTVSGGGGQPSGGVGGLTGAATTSLPSATVRANSTPVSSKAILQKLPLRVYKRLEEIINKCSYMEWKHFDAGVVKVMAQLADIGEEDVFEELELLKSTDLSNVEYMPAYLNKRLNNRLWSRRKMLTSAAAGTSTAISAMGGP